MRRLLTAIAAGVAAVALLSAPAGAVQGGADDPAGVARALARRVEARDRGRLQAAGVAGETHRGAGRPTVIADESDGRITLLFS